MINCPNCNSNINQGEKFCKACGTKIVYEQQPIVNNNIDDETLINAYIGKNADKLKNNGFSFNSLFFGSIYVLYRKMWLLGIIWYFISIFLGGLSSIY